MDTKTQLGYEQNFFEIGFVHTKVAEQTCSMFVTRATLFFVMHVKSAIKCIYSCKLNILYLIVLTENVYTLTMIKYFLLYVLFAKLERIKHFL